MKFTEPQVEWWQQTSLIRHIARVGRICYKAKGRQPEDGLHAMCKEFPGIELFKICVSARESTRLYRGVSQERMDRDKQRELMPLSFYDAVIFNNGTLSELRDEVQRVRYMI